MAQKEVEVELSPRFRNAASKTVDTFTGAVDSVETHFGNFFYFIKALGILTFGLIVLSVLKFVAEAFVVAATNANPYGILIVYTIYLIAVVTLGVWFIFQLAKLFKSFAKVGSSVFTAQRSVIDLNKSVFKQKKLPVKITVSDKNNSKRKTKSTKKTKKAKKSKVKK